MQVKIEVWWAHIPGSILDPQMEWGTGWVNRKIGRANWRKTSHFRVTGIPTLDSIRPRIQRRQEHAGAAVTAGFPAVTVFLDRHDPAP